MIQYRLARGDLSYTRWSRIDQTFVAIELAALEEVGAVAFKYCAENGGVQ